MTHSTRNITPADADCIAFFNKLRFMTPEIARDIFHRQMSSTMPTRKQLEEYVTELHTAVLAGATAFTRTDWEMLALKIECLTRIYQEKNSPLLQQQLTASLEQFEKYFAWYERQTPSQWQEPQTPQNDVVPPKKHVLGLGDQLLPYTLDLKISYFRRQYLPQWDNALFFKPIPSALFTPHWRSVLAYVGAILAILTCAAGLVPLGMLLFSLLVEPLGLIATIMLLTGLIVACKIPVAAVFIYLNNNGQPATTRPLTIEAQNQGTPDVPESPAATDMETPREIFFSRPLTPRTPPSQAAAAPPGLHTPTKLVQAF